MVAKKKKKTRTVYTRYTPYTRPIIITYTYSGLGHPPELLHKYILLHCTYTYMYIIHEPTVLTYYYYATQQHPPRTTSTNRENMTIK